MSANPSDEMLAAADAIDAVNNQVVDLDPPAPEIARWRELASVDHGVMHDGDASKVIPFPRPAWSDPDNDVIGANLWQCRYASEWVDVPLAHVNGWGDGEYFEPATVRVRVRLDGKGNYIVGMGDRRRTNDGKWSIYTGVGMTAAEATELAHVLLAAVDLINGSQQ